MSFYANNNRIHVTDVAGNLVFDTNRKMFAVTDTVTGAVSITNKGTSSVMHTDDQVLAAINPGADFVMGQCITTSHGGGNGGFPNIGAFNVGGSIVWGWQRYIAANLMKAFWTVTFMAQNGQLILREDWFNGGGTSENATIVGGTLNYKIHCGTWV